MLTISPDSPLTRSANPFETARLALIKRLLAATTPKAMGAYPLASDFLEIARHVRDFAGIFDEWIETIGFQVQDNTTCESFDTRSFSGAFSGAVDGNATFIIEECAAELRDAQIEAARGRRIA